ncbi:MAG: hypothetical protein WCF84_18680 [Anaerolineae bacterium]
MKLDLGRLFDVLVKLIVKLLMALLVLLVVVIIVLAALLLALLIIAPYALFVGIVGAWGYAVWMCVNDVLVFYSLFGGGPSVAILVLCVGVCALMLPAKACKASEKLAVWGSFLASALLCWGLHLAIDQALNDSAMRMALVVAPLVVMLVLLVKIRQREKSRPPTPVAAGIGVRPETTEEDASRPDLNDSAN